MAGTATYLRWILFVMTLLALIGSILIFAFTVFYYYEMNSLHGVSTIIGGYFKVPSFNKVMVLYYLLMTISLICMVTCLCGCQGTYYGDDRSLFYFTIFIGGIILGLVIFFICYSLFEKEISGELHSWLNTYIVEFYGGNYTINKIFDMTVEAAQSEGCCGGDPPKGNYSAYMTILYWLETTQWGAKRSINVSGKALIDAVPATCFKADAELTKLVYDDRLQWNLTEEQRWSRLISTEGCKDHLVEFIWKHYSNIVIGVGTTLVLLLIFSLVASIVVRRYLLQSYSEED